MKKYVLLVILFLAIPFSAFADDLNQACQNLWGSLPGSYNAILEYANGATESFRLTFTRTSVLGLNLAKGTEQIQVQLMNSTIGSLDTCKIAGEHVTFTELAVPNMYEADFGDLHGVLTLNKLP